MEVTYINAQPIPGNALQRICQLCGVNVWDIATHTAWHNRQEKTIPEDRLNLAAVLRMTASNLMGHKQELQTSLSVDAFAQVNEAYRGLIRAADRLEE